MTVSAHCYYYYYYYICYYAMEVDWLRDDSKCPLLLLLLLLHLLLCYVS